MKVSDVIYREDLYPRFNFDEETVNQYRLNIDQLPPIVISENNILIDGYHRLIAYRIEQKQDIPVEVLPITDEKEILREAIKRNALHGRQLTMPEKKKWARHYFDQLTISELHELLQVSTGKISEWTTDLNQAKSEEEKQKVIDLWLACKTQDEIANIMGLTQGRIAQIIKNFKDENFNNLSQNSPESLKIFNLWNFGKSGDVLQYPGQIPSQIIENLLWYYTKPFDIVYDPMAGGGTTIRVCQQIYRRWQASDIAPIINEIKAHDITTGFPNWLIKPDFIFLDPPYWNMKEGEYSNDETNLANMSLENYYQAINGIAKSAKKELRNGGHIHYRQITESVIKQIELPKYSSNTDIIENVRNRLHYQDNRFQYYRNGYFGLLEWHKRNKQLLLWGDDYFHLPLKASYIMSAIKEAQGRVKYVLNKFEVNEVKHYTNLETGLINEYHIKQWFMQNFPKYYQPPVNEGIYTIPSLDDWMLKINKNVLHFDVKTHNGRTEIEQYRTRNDRIFILANIVNNKKITIYGFTTSKWLKKYGVIVKKEWYDKSIKQYYTIETTSLYPFKQLRAYLNCLTLNINFEYF